MTDANRRLVKDVASELESRRRRRKLILLAIWAALIIAAIVWLRCGRGWGLGGGKGSGTDKGSGVAVTGDAGPTRCTIRVTAEGIAVDGVTTTRDEAVAACETTGRAEVIVTGDARQGDWDELRAALHAAGVQVHLVIKNPGSTVMPDGEAPEPGSAGSAEP